SGSMLSILRGYNPPSPHIVSFEGAHYMHGSPGYSDSLREVVSNRLFVVSNCEIAKITVYADGRRALYWGNVAGDAWTQPLMDEGARAHLDSWPRNNL